MERSDKIILVTGATGHQGGAAARHLLEDGWRVRALTRDPGKAEAHSLQELGAEVMRVNMLDRTAVDSAMEGAYGVYLMGTSMEGGARGEERMDHDVIDSARAHGIEHLVYSSTIGAGQPGGLPWVQPKSHLERFIRDSGLPATIWRPAYFMENNLFHKDEIFAGKFTGTDWPDTVHPMIAVDDIGRFVALAFSDPRRFVSATMTIAGDEPTFAEMAETFSSVIGIPVVYERTQTPSEPAPPMPGPRDEQFPEIDLEACRRLIPDLANFEEWVRATGWKASVRSGG